jgi:anti-sigma regulatory factor (Ser/Thr protein kinase)
MPLDTGCTDLRHNALIHKSEDEFLECSVPFVREGLEAGEGAIVARTRPGLAVMREALGADADGVSFVDVGSSYTRPARMLAAYHRVFSEHLRLTPALRVVADVQFGPDPGEWDLWTGYEAVSNRAFGHLPVWVLCSYSVNATPDRILEGVWRTHPEVLSGDGWKTSDHLEDPDELLRRLTPPPEPLDGLRSLSFGGDLEQLREGLARELAAEGGNGLKALELLLAATELAKNALEHGGGIEDVRVGRERGRFVCEIVDRGPGFDDPAAGYVAPREGGGTGLWVARQLAWELELFRSPGGFTARIWL